MMEERKQTVAVPLGRTVITASAQRVLAESDVDRALQRHSLRDWGEVGSLDWEANEEAMREGARLLSSYTGSSGCRFWVITEADRSTTTVLLPEDY